MDNVSNNGEAWQQVYILKFLHAWRLCGTFVWSSDKRVSRVTEYGMLYLLFGVCLVI
jgi:hypothetical protein